MALSTVAIMPAVKKSPLLKTARANKKCRTGHHPRNIHSAGPILCSTPRVCGTGSKTTSTTASRSTKGHRPKTRAGQATSKLGTPGETGVFVRGRFSLIERRTGAGRRHPTMTRHRPDVPRTNEETVRVGITEFQRPGSFCQMLRPRSKLSRGHEVRSVMTQRSALREGAMRRWNGSVTSRLSTATPPRLVPRGGLRPGASLAAMLVR